MRASFWGIGLLAALGLSAGAGCSHQPKGGYAASVHPDAVVVDFHNTQSRTAMCSGTLVSANVVLTSAHCADGSVGATVKAPEAGGRVSTVSRVYTYSWHPEHDHAMQNDLALLVLKTPIRLSQYAHIQQEACDGCGVAALHRTHTGSGAKADIVETSHMKLARVPTAAHPLAMYAPIGASGDSGGAVYRTDGRGKGFVVGVTIGTGAASGGSYVARLDDPDVQRWISDITFVASKQAAGTTTGQRVHHAGIRLQDNTDCTADGDSCNSDGDCCSNSCQDDGTCASSSDQQQQTGGNEGDSCSSDSDCSDGLSCDPNSGTCTSQDPVQSDGTDQSGDDSGADTPVVGDDAGDPTGDDAGNPTGDDAGDPTGDDAGDDASTGDDGGPPPDENVVEGGGANDADGGPGDDGGDNMMTGDDAGDDGGMATDTYDADAGYRTGTRRTITTTSTNNTFIANPTKDENGKPMTDGFMQGAQNYANAHPGVNTIAIHGNKGFLEEAPSMAQLQAMGMNGKPIVMASCDAGANSPYPEDMGRTTANQIAQQSGVDPGNVYACSDLVFSANNSLQCNGNWVDGNGNQLSNAQRSSAGLQNCGATPLPPPPPGRYRLMNCN